VSLIIDNHIAILWCVMPRSRTRAYQTYQNVRCRNQNHNTNFF